MTARHITRNDLKKMKFKKQKKCVMNPNSKYCTYTAYFPWETNTLLMKSVSETG